ncbi:sigma-70 family RNA polymerase sigma factor [Brevibacillus thermoruber]|uniref:Sigma-70 family RNA polymerase sigma factor n=1 Tax=Brevibacillus thermoruber TaxID=33942 RepID=A0A9X3TTS2_9BACL|nr:sigma-70 family RNA polymerase sigma factor [Brevibacillus thermoruber]MDA5109945.1 sigma-70 family RNA polymerase sigma factor [Brevibacillus thermoruber]
MSSIFAALSLLFKELMLFVAYVKNNAFPQPLPDTEEEKYLRLMAEGDPYARNKLIEHNLRLVAHIVKKFENTGEDSEDLISIGTIGLIKAIESYQVEKGTKLATYAARCIENEILMHLRSLKKTKKDVSLHDPIGTDKEGNEFTLALYPFESPSRVRRALLVLCTSASLQCGVSLLSMSAKKPCSRHVSHFPCMGMHNPPLPRYPSLCSRSITLVTVRQNPDGHRSIFQLVNGFSS